jgi:MOSC domain-containing protein YiiM
MSDSARVLSLQVGVPVTRGDADADDPMDRLWTSAIVKAPVPGRCWLGRTNLDGDAQADLVHHGGPDKAVLAYSVEHYPAWRAEVAVWHEALPHGAFGENFTVSAWTESDVCLGDVHAVGDALVQVSQPRAPCWKLARRWRVPDLVQRVQAHGRTGWYYRVLREGWVDAGAALTLVERPMPSWSIAALNALRYRRDIDAPDHVAAARVLAGTALLAASWRSLFATRLQGVDFTDAARTQGPSLTS